MAYIGSQVQTLREFSKHVVSKMPETRGSGGVNRVIVFYCLKHIKEMYSLTLNNQMIEHRNSDLFVIFQRMQIYF